MVEQVRATNPGTGARFGAAEIWLWWEGPTLGKTPGAQFKATRVGSWRGLWRAPRRAELLPWRAPVGRGKPARLGSGAAPAGWNQRRPGR
jgi:hypothetical protein